MEKQQTLYKLIVLYMLDKIDFSMTFSQISSFVLDREYTTYFNLQMAIHDLADSGLVHVETIRNISYYTITPEGSETVGYFKNKISPEIREDIDDFLKSHRLQMRNEVSVLSDYYRTTAGEYEVRLKVREKHGTLMDLMLTVPEEAQARAIAESWKERAEDVYGYLMRELMK